MIRWNRGSRDHHLHQREDAYLNLIPLIDILSVMVAFLLVYSVDVEVVQNSKGVEIPQSTADALPNHSVVVMITRDQVFVQGELVADITDIADPRTEVIEPLLAVLLRPMVGVDAEQQEADELATVNLLAAAGYDRPGPTAQSVTIFDDTPTVNVYATRLKLIEGVDSTELIFTRQPTYTTSFPMTVSYRIGGTAVNGSDYTYLSGVIAIEAGQTEARVTVSATRSEAASATT